MSHKFFKTMCAFGCCWLLGCPTKIIKIASFHKGKENSNRCSTSFGWIQSIYSFRIDEFCAWFELKALSVWASTFSTQIQTWITKHSTWKLQHYFLGMLWTPNSSKFSGAHLHCPPPGQWYLTLPPKAPIDTTTPTAWPPGRADSPPSGSAIQIQERQRDSFGFQSCTTSRGETRRIEGTKSNITKDYHVNVPYSEQ